MKTPVPPSVLPVSYTRSGLVSWIAAVIATAPATLAGAGEALAADMVKGGQIYAMHCASCHGGNGSSVMPGAPNLARGEGLMKPDMQLLASIRAGRNAMPAYIGVLRDGEILDVVAYMRTLRR
jgi:cytochrome c6